MRRRGNHSPAIQLDLADRVVVELLDHLAAGRHATSDLLRDVFRSHSLKSGQQKRVKDVFHGVLASTRMIEHAFATVVPGPITPTLRAPLRVLAARVLRGDLAPGAAGERAPWVDWRRVAAIPAEVATLADPVERLQLRGSIPDWLARALHEQFAGEADALLGALAERAPTTLRANTLRCSRDGLVARLAAEDGIEARPTAHARHGVHVLTPARLFRTAAYRDGWFEMQDEASQLVAELVAPPPRGDVLDACAGSGGKTLAVAALLDNRGRILAVDEDRRRIADLKTRARRAGAFNTRAQRIPADAWPSDVTAFAAHADRILVDVPCSGIGSWRRHPDGRAWLDRDALRALHDTQHRLLARAVASLQPRARVIYATCTVLRAENQDVVEEVLGADAGLELVPVVEVLGGERGRAVADPTGSYLQTLPHRHGCDGFFAAVLRRRGR